MYRVTTMYRTSDNSKVESKYITHVTTTTVHNEGKLITNTLITWCKLMTFIPCTLQDACKACSKTGFPHLYWQHSFYGQGKSGKVPRCKSLFLTKMQKKFWTDVRRLHATVQNFFCSQIICTSSFKFVPLPLFPVWLRGLKATLVIHTNKVVRENDSFFPGKSGRMNSAE